MSEKTSQEFNKDVVGADMENVSQQESVDVGRRFRVKGIDYEFSGLVDDKESRDNGKPMGRVADGGDLYRVFGEDEVERGVFTYETEELIQDIDGGLKAAFRDYWERECLNNKERNPGNAPMPKL